ncbi:peptide-methionine (S)-S-oxide reductase MsrA [Methylomicrobium sp. Wu6]|uniref:peptide-methionine (S)-S-oxide reductase MsrA n=1 Tax=Methylomicrobium sp. Wu6 TaxID=3107928 RepID=UPI002DD6933A|nr:peptide-methionine (S)-S-oxide reductase MsrA [Methylomicrobium sp. Wu6]
MLAVAVGTSLISPRLAGYSANSSLNKAAVGPHTPYIVLGMGCFWGAEKRMQALAGVLNVEAGYAGGDIPQPSYQTLHDTEASIQEGKAVKNHAEVVKVYYDPKQATLERVLIQFWENHNPTQGNRQGNDIGSNYRSAVFYRTDEERRLAEKTRAIYQANLQAAGIAKPITTEIAPLKNYAAAEDYHQDYLEKNPLGYCGLGGTGVAYLDPHLPAHGEKDHQPQVAANSLDAEPTWQQIKLNAEEQLIAFEAIDCGYCRQFDKEVLSTWKNPIPIVSTNLTEPPSGWTLSQELLATPTIVLFRNRQEVARYTGYQGAQKFWEWLGSVSI